MFSRIPLSAILFAALAVAAPSPATEKSLLPRAQVSTTDWAGSAYHYPAGSIKGVSASFVVPKLSVPSGGSSSKAYIMNVLLGIDGINCASANLQAGVQMTIANGQTTYTPFFYFAPGPSTAMSAPQISAGDSLTVTVTTSSKTAATIFIKNTTKGTSVTQTVTSTTALCQQDVEWSIQSTSDVTTVPNFTPFKYTSTVATLNSGSTIGSSNGDAINMVDSTGKSIVSTSLAGGNIAITHI